MNRSTWLQILRSLGVALAVTGVAYGVALGWSATGGIHALWIATLAAFVSTMLGLLAAGAVRDMGTRPEGAPSAFLVGWVGSLVLMALSFAPVLALHMAPLVPFLVWLLVHAAAQAALQWRVFRREDADEMAGRPPAVKA